MCYFVYQAQKLLVTTVDQDNFVPGAVLACVGLASQLGGAADAAGS